jgi:hypothetical protein
MRSPSRPPRVALIGNIAAGGKPANQNIRSPPGYNDPCCGMQEGVSRRMQLLRLMIIEPALLFLAAGSDKHLVGFSQLTGRDCSG